MSVSVKQKPLWYCTSMCAVTVLLVLSNAAHAIGTLTPEVNGTLSEIEGVRVLRVWGTPQERGFAHGYLLADKIVPLFDELVGTDELGGGAEGYRNRILPILEKMKIDPQFVAELQGMLAGIEAKAEGRVEVPRLGRFLRYDDLAALNCLADFMKMGCSSFAAWGSMTTDGATIAGRNADYLTVPGLFGADIVVVNTPCDDSGALGWVSVTWPGMLWCLTGINAEGVTVSLHNAEGYPPSVDSGFTPRGFTFRKAIESVRSDTAFEEVLHVLQEHVSLVGNNVVVTRPHVGKGDGAAVFEYDGDLIRNEGVTARNADASQNFIVCTNDYLTRSRSGRRDRYSTLIAELRRIAASGGEHPLTPARAWSMLRSVTVPWNTTYHSVVFEPNKRLIHVGFARDGKDAPYYDFATLDVVELLKKGKP